MEVVRTAVMGWSEGKDVGGVERRCGEREEGRVLPEGRLDREEECGAEDSIDV